MAQEVMITSSLRQRQLEQMWQLRLRQEQMRQLVQRQLKIRQPFRHKRSKLKPAERQQEQSVSFSVP